MAQAFMTFLSQTGVWVGGLGLAAFLSLFWVLRGAPLGQTVAFEEDADAPRGGYRDRVVAAVCIGMVLILAGAYLAVTRGVQWAIPAFALGFGTVLTLVLINGRFRHGSPTMRRTLDVSTAALNASLVAGVLIVLNVIAFRYGGRPIDMTREQTFTLSRLSINQARSLQRPVTFTTFFGRSPVALQQYDRVQTLLEMYRAAHPEMVRLNHVDPFRDLSRYEALATRVPDMDVTQGGGVVVEYGAGEGAERVVVRNADLFTQPRAGRFDPDVDRFESVFKGEDAITSALIRLREAKKPRVVFTTGHGEPSLDDMEPGRSGLGVWRARLTGTGAEVSAVNLLTQDLPDDVAVVVVAGPKSPFKPEEVTRLRAAVDRKIPALLLLGDTESTGLEDFLRGFGVDLRKGFTVEPRLNYPRQREVVLVPVTNPTHPILDSLDNEILFFPRPAPLNVVAGTAGPAATVLATPLLKTSRESWVEPDLTTRRAEKNPGDQPGPVNVGVVVTDRPGPGAVSAESPPTPRLVVFSSRYLADNTILRLDPVNLDLLMNALSWLRGRPDTVGLGPKTTVSTFLTPDPVMRARLVLVPTVLAVLLIITLGVTTYVARRN